MNFHSLFLTIGLTTVVGTLISLRREHIRTEYSVSWLAVGLILTFLAVFPGALERAARNIDVDPRLFFLIVGGALISGLVFEISHVVSKLRDENVMLAQRLAMLEYQMRRAKEGDGETGQ
jgi:hypothetical protein